MSAPRAAAQLLRLPVSLGYSFRPQLDGTGSAFQSRQLHVVPSQGNTRTGLALPAELEKPAQGPPIYLAQSWSQRVVRVQFVATSPARRSVSWVVRRRADIPL